MYDWIYCVVTSIMLSNLYNSSNSGYGVSVKLIVRLNWLHYGPSWMLRDLDFGRVIQESTFLTFLF